LVEVGDGIGRSSRNRGNRGNWGNGGNGENSIPPSMLGNEEGNWVSFVKKIMAWLITSLQNH